MIKYITYVLLLFSVKAELRIYITDTPIQRIGNRIYKKELLTDKYASPKELSYDSSSRNVFFMYMDDLLQNSGRAYVNAVTKQTKKINGIEKNKATAVDTESGDVYFGSEDGLHKYDPLTNEAKSVGLLYNMNIMKLVIRNNQMYLLDGNNHMIYKVFNDMTATVRVGDMQTVIDFDVDHERSIHFVTMCGLYCAVDGQIVKNQDLNLVYNFIIDEQRVFGLTDEGLFIINCRNGTALKVAELDFEPRSLIFGDYGDIFYSVDDKIFRLRPVNYRVYTIHRRTTT